MKIFVTKLEVVKLVSFFIKEKLSGGKSGNGNRNNQVTRFFRQLGAVRTWNYHEHPTKVQNTILNLSH